MNSISVSPLFSIPSSKPPAAITAVTLAFPTFCTTAEIPIPKTRKKPAVERTSPKPTTIIPPTPILTPTSPSHPAIPLKKVLVPIGFGTEEMEAVIITNVLRRAGAAVTVASVEEQLEVEASGGIRLVADALVSDCSDESFDLVALPGGMPGSVRLRDSKVLQQITTKQAEGKRLYGAICAAPAVTLLPWGLIKRKQTTCHPAFMDKLPTFWAVKSNLQVSGELTTSRGPGTSFEFAVSFVGQLFGESAAKDICDSMLINVTDENFRNGGNPRKEEFNETSWSLDHTPQVIIPVVNGMDEIEVVTMVDILRRAKVDVTVASVGKSLHITASGGLKIVADKTISAASKSVYDLIILPGGRSGDERLSRSRILKKMLREQESSGRILGAIGTSPAILQRIGLLKEKHFTIHPSVTSTVDGALDGAQVVIDGQLITGKGLSTTTHFTLAIVSKLFGKARARSVAEGLVFEYPKVI